ncbi:DUF6268 family outer membrane beta-barrel protein [Maribacter sp. 2308TA10-17]|uniref:DUF6268 family outer membrane beta-barrel protein n=1 Tax=Maribacter sp. 2308TA10-17 TaxID=3386276 RepID=UPI0039BC71A9
MKQHFFCAFLFFLISCFALSQTPDLLRLEYTAIPENKSGIRTNRYRAVLNVPFKIKTHNYLVIGAEYNKYDFRVGQQLPFNTSTLERLHIVDFNLGYSFKWNETWRFIGAVQPRLASNFVLGIIDNNDFRVNLSGVMMKEKKDIEKPFRLIVGLSFNSATGLPFPLPVVNYYKRFHPNWSYTIGIPRQDFKYHSNSGKHVLQAALFLDGYFINIQNDVLLPGNAVGESISLSALVSAVGYQYKFTKEISLYALFGYSLLQEGLIRDGNRNSAFTLNDKGNIYLRTGFKIGIF